MPTSMARCGTACNTNAHTNKEQLPFPFNKLCETAIARARAPQPASFIFTARPLDRSRFFMDYFISLRTAGLNTPLPVCNDEKRPSQPFHTANLLSFQAFSQLDRSACFPNATCTACTTPRLARPQPRRLRQPVRQLRAAGRCAEVGWGLSAQVESSGPVGLKGAMAQ
jgi:hypothetical protein